MRYKGRKLGGNEKERIKGSIHQFTRVYVILFDSVPPHTIRLMKGRVCDLYDSLLFILTMLSPVRVLLWIFESGWRLDEVHSDDVVVGGPLGGEDRVRAGHEPEWGVWGCHYVVDPCTILACPLHTCRSIK